MTAGAASRMRVSASADVGRGAAAVAGDDRGHAHADEVGRRRMIREVVGVRVDVDEAGRHDQVASVDRFCAPCEAGIGPIAAIRPSLIATSAEWPRRPVPSITRPPTITMS